MGIAEWDSYTASYSGKDVYESVQYAIALKEAGQTRGSKFRKQTSRSLIYAS